MSPCPLPFRSFASDRGPASWHSRTIGVHSPRGCHPPSSKLSFVCIELVWSQVRINERNEWLKIAHGLKVQRERTKINRSEGRNCKNVPKPNMFQIFKKRPGVRSTRHCVKKCPQWAAYFSKNASLPYSSRSVFAGSMPAIRRVGTAVAMRITDASSRTTTMIVGTS